MAGATQGGKSAVRMAALRSALQWGWLGALVAGVFVAAFALSRTQSTAEAIAGDETPVLAADAALGEAVRAGDKTAARRLLALQFGFIDADGKNHMRRDFLSDLKSHTAAPVSDVKVRLYGLLATVTGHRMSSSDTEVFVLDIWAKQKGTWRALLMQEVVTAAADAPVATVGDAPPATEPPQIECRNPCQTIPYRVRSATEQEIIVTFQAVEKAVLAHDAAEWGKHVADEFVRYGSGQVPVPKSERITAIEHQKVADGAVIIAEVEMMRLAVYGDGAAMTALQTMPNSSRPPYRAARIWVRRNGQWQMAISVHTDVK
jgi:Domain of unknown function (DUF4440)